MLEFDLNIKAGDSYLSPRWAFIIGGAAVELEPTWAVRAQIRTRPETETVLYEFDPEQILLGHAPIQIGTVTVSTSTVQFYIPPEQTAGFVDWAASAVWDLEITNSEYGPGGTQFRRTPVGGRVRAHWDVTR